MFIAIRSLPGLLQASYQVPALIVRPFSIALSDAGLKIGTNFLFFSGFNSIFERDLHHKNSCISNPAANLSISLNSSTASENSFSKKPIPKKKCLFDYDESMIKNKSTSELGKGSYGSVKLVRDKEDGGLYAMKIVKKWNL